MKYRVWISSKPGFYAQYDGTVNVVADNPSEAISIALKRLRTGSFRDRTDDMWRIDKVECLHDFNRRHL